MEYKKARKANAIATLPFFIVFTIIAVVLVVLSIVLTKPKIPENYVEVDATIVEIKEEYESINDDTPKLSVFVGYEYEGEEYKEELDQTDSKMKVDQSIKIYVNPDDPSSLKTPISTSTRIIFIVVASALLAIGIGGTAGQIVKFRKKVAAGSSMNITVDSTLSDTYSETSKTYHFYECGKMNQSYALKVPDGDVLFEANLKKFSLVGNSDYEFTNKQTLRTKMHKIGKPISVNYGNGSTSVVGDSYFKLDGVNVFDYLDANGYNFRTDSFNVLHPVLTLYKGDQIVASYKYNVKSKREKNVMGVGNVQYGMEVTTSCENLDLVFLGALAIYRCDFALSRM